MAVVVAVSIVVADDSAVVGPGNIMPEKGLDLYDDPEHFDAQADHGAGCDDVDDIALEAEQSDSGA